MAHLFLHDEEVSALAALIGSHGYRGRGVPGESLLAGLAALFAADAAILIHAHLSGRILGEVVFPAGGIRPTSRGVRFLGVAVECGPDRVAQLWLLRHRTDFDVRDKALLALVSPALEWILGEPGQAPRPELTSVASA